MERDLQTRLYQRHLLHTECTHPFHVVIIAQTNLRTQARAHGLLCRSALDLAYPPLVDA